MAGASLHDDDSLRAGYLEPLVVGVILRGYLHIAGVGVIADAVPVVTQALPHDGGRHVHHPVKCVYPAADFFHAALQVHGHRPQVMPVVEGAQGPALHAFPDTPFPGLRGDGPASLSHNELNTHVARFTYLAAVDDLFRGHHRGVPHVVVE